MYESGRIRCARVGRRVGGEGKGGRDVEGEYYVVFNDTATTEIYTLSLLDALPILYQFMDKLFYFINAKINFLSRWRQYFIPRSEEHTSELQSRQYLVCRLLLEKKYIRSCTPYERVLVTRDFFPVLSALNSAQSLSI